uniref:YrhK domain-containing protein n=1 Tax=Strongyloides papillosus TaxID=174720 RepID=A0A0N5BCD1_STREA
MSFDSEIRTKLNHKLRSETSECKSCTDNGKSIYYKFNLVPYQNVIFLNIGLGICIIFGYIITFASTLQLYSYNGLPEAFFFIIMGSIGHVFLIRNQIYRGITIFSFTVLLSILVGLGYAVFICCMYSDEETLKPQLSVVGEILLVSFFEIGSLIFLTNTSLKKISIHVFMEQIFDEGKDKKEVKNGTEKDKPKDSVVTSITSAPTNSTQLPTNYSHPNDTTT